MSFRRTLLFSILVFFAIAAAFASGYLTHAALHPASPFPLLEEAYDLLRSHGLYDLPPAPALEYGAVRGMVQAYGDPYTLFVEPPQNELQNNELNGAFGGAGLTLETTLDGRVVIHPIPGAPAEAAGLRDGDVLIAVDTLNITPDTPPENVQAALRGPEGSLVRLTVQRPPAWTTLEVSLRRAVFDLPSVTWHADGDEPRLGVVVVHRMAATTADEIRAAVAALAERGAAHIALDLRGNGGGLLDSGIASARLFLSGGEIIRQQYRGQAVETVSVEEPGPLLATPLAVLVDGGTASAAELVAGALQAHGRAPLIGLPTYGKDTLQLLLPLSDGSSLHVTAARWWVPGLEHPIGEGGLQPDIPVEADEAHPKAWLRAAAAYFFPPENAP